METKPTYTAIDISSFFIRRGVNLLKLNKLLYYAQVWYFVKHDKLLFSEKIQSWVYGPVIGEVWENFRYAKRSRTIPYISATGPVLNIEIMEHLAYVWHLYGHLKASQLMDLVTSEKPWIYRGFGRFKDQPDFAEIRINKETTADFKLNADNHIPVIDENPKAMRRFGNIF